MKRLLSALAISASLVLLPGSVLAADEVFSGTLRGANEVPPVSTTATGSAYVFINEAGTEVKYAVSYTGLSSQLIAAHIHVAPAGENGPIALPLQIGPSTMFGTLTQANLQPSGAASTWDAVLDAIREGRAYVNLHTTNHPAGEIRAQLSGSATPTAAPTARPTARPTAAGTPRPTTTPAATTRPATTSPTTDSTPPPTSADPLTGRQRSSDVGAVLIVLVAAIVAGTAAAWKLQGPRRTRDDWD